MTTRQRTHKTKRGHSRYNELLKTNLMYFVPSENPFPELTDREFHFILLQAQGYPLAIVSETLQIKETTARHWSGLIHKKIRKYLGVGRNPNVMMAILLANAWYREATDSARNTGYPTTNPQ